MNIVQVYKDYFPVVGGIENHIKWAAERLVARGHTLTVVVTSLDARTRVEIVTGVRVVKCGRLVNVQSAPISLSMARELRSATLGADIAHLHAPYPPGETLNLLVGRARKTVITWHSDIVRQRALLRFYGPVLRQVIKRADRIFPTSMRYAQSSPWISGYLDKCRPVPSAIDPARFAPVPGQAAAVRARFGLGSRFTTVSVGRLRYYKGFGTLIQALPSLPDVAALIVGVGPMEAEWRSLAQRLGVANRVIFAGEPSDAELAAYYQAADVFVLPANSRAEAYGLAILEAMACGLPAITTEIGTGTSWLNVDGETGIVVPPEDPAALGSAIASLRVDPVRRARMAAAAIGRVQGDFTADRMVDELERNYAEVLAG